MEKHIKLRLDRDEIIMELKTKLNFLNCDEYKKLLSKAGDLAKQLEDTVKEINEFDFKIKIN
ncbi:MAG: hypothetical protein K0S34_107 [Bacillales bacterium]|jgi:hypothetical protein|nr:hypothetical protein [Bacillales bacterium]